MNDAPQPSAESRHPIQVVARRTGLSPDLLRAWERRYGVVTPGRSAGSHRLYSDADIERLNLIRQALAGGRRIHQVARLSPVDLRALLEEDRSARGPSPVPFVAQKAGGATESAGPDDLAPFLAAIRSLDQTRLDALLSDAALRLPVPLLVENVLRPLLDQVGHEWTAGNLRISNEHLASAAIRSFLGGLRPAQPAPAGAPELIVATPAGQLHELGALTAALVAEADGWHVTYLGPNVPADDLAAAARQRAPRAIALSVTYPPDDPQLARELTRLRRALPQGVALVIGGSSAAAYERTLREIGAHLVEDPAALRRQLDALRREVL
jgi:methanogenic corrinoid protein MtbC1/transposase-like protein